uniref:Uncharacterized protein n=1 Tax=Anguilla anguilla TaxID=7936 RepID=A0A0E9S6S8_ANGAN
MYIPWCTYWLGITKEKPDWTISFAQNVVIGSSKFRESCLTPL